MTAEISIKTNSLFTVCILRGFSTFSFFTKLLTFHCFCYALGHNNKVLLTEKKKWPFFTAKKKKKTTKYLKIPWRSLKMSWTNRFTAS